MPYTKIIFSFSLIFSLMGCAGQLMVFDSKGNVIQGVPFRAAEVYVKNGLHTQHTKGGDCEPTPFVETVSLPTGAKYFVTAKTAQFSKTAFHVKFSENGAVSEIGLDSEPSIADTLKATTDLLKVFIKPPGVAAAAGAAAATPKLQACDTGEHNVNFSTLEEWIGKQKK